MPDYFAVGTRVRLTHAVDRYPHFIAPEGATGVVVESHPELVRVRMDEHIDGADDWDNEVHWSNDELDPRGPDLLSENWSHITDDLEVVS